MQTFSRLTELPAETSTLVELLRKRATRQSQFRAYTFLNNDEESNLSYAELDRKARSIAALLQQHVKPGERALLLFPPGLDFIASFFGSLYSGVIAVPVYPPNPDQLDRTLPRLLAIIRDARPLV